MNDPTEHVRRGLVRDINTHPEDRKTLEALFGTVWDPEELRKDFEVLGFAAPFVVAIRKSDGKRGSLLFQHHPRLYYGFLADE